MKKAILTSLLAATCMSAGAQVITDTVSTGATYVNQVWYSLSADEQGNAPKNNWDLAFDVSGFGATILINSITGTTLYNYPKADLSGWATVDTTGLSTWTARWNAETSWAYGAMGNYADPANAYDLDWGTYNLTTHVVTGDSIYIIKLANGAYKKLAIESLSGSVYNFKYADLDGSNAHTATLDKSAYSGKNFGYYSIQSNAALNREPLAANWDLLFTQYTAFIPGPYTVTGILTNNNVAVAKCINIANVATYTDWASATFSTNINAIGYNWKTFTGMAYEIQDSTVYFVKTATGDIWKMILTGFSGSSTGSFMFSKEKLYTQTGIQEAAGTTKASMALYPNPAVGTNVSVIYSLPTTATTATLTVSDMAGRTVSETTLLAQQGLQQYQLPASSLKAGSYIINLHTGNSSVQQKLIVQ